MTSTSLHMADEQLRRVCLEELAASGLQVPDDDRELVVALLLAARREDLERPAGAVA